MRKNILLIIIVSCVYETAIGQGIEYFWYGDFYCHKTEGGVIIEAPDQNPSLLRYKGDIVFPEEVTDSMGNVYRVKGLDKAVPRDNVTSIKIPHDVEMIWLCFPLFPNDYSHPEIPISFYPGDNKGKYFYLDDEFLYTCDKDTIESPLYARKSYIIPDKVKALFLFWRLDSLERVILPNTIETLMMSFQDCPQLSEINFPESLKHILSGTFERCKSLKKVDLSHIEDLGNQTFQESGLEEVIIPDQIKKLTFGVFKDCKNITRIILPDTMRHIGNDCFKDVNINHRTIKFPLSVDTIGDGAFNCWDAQKIVLSESTKLLGIFSFGSVDTLVCKALVPPAFNHKSYAPYSRPWCESVKCLYVPKESVDLYKKADEWNQISDIRAIGTEPKPVESLCPDDKHPHAIDLGLPSGTLWACCNIGAAKPEEYGGYYAWGETEEKDLYNDVTYQYCTGVDSDGDGWYSYHEEKSYQILGPDIAGTQYDVAHLKWAGGWAMPSYDQLKELSINCYFNEASENGVSGYTFESRDGYGRKIFLPGAGGYFGDYEAMTDNKPSGYYWSSEPHPKELSEAYSLRLCVSKDIKKYHRSYGLSIRPVIIATNGINLHQSTSDKSSQAVYNLQGIKVADSIEGQRTLLPGLYILNGKKFLVK